MFTDKQLEKIRRDKESLAKTYQVSETSIVYIGDNHYIVVVNGKEIRI